MCGFVSNNSGHLGNPCHVIAMTRQRRCQTKKMSEQRFLAFWHGSHSVVVVDLFHSLQTSENKTTRKVSDHIEMSVHREDPRTALVCNRDIDASIIFLLYTLSDKTLKDRVELATIRAMMTN
ncbi:uncharacterized protein PV09_05681 [Verruconis gallopava]|uniref:Uncharacterized protein n=1 Tax=Verruconis gallopava TaxID=253628 RepID=A0A0D1YR54_9PEZI|nr:uncharacterized protein PV09_05681 [Verruconis gallopava]KIW03027.1 hypothetical protein PV09_05681 [Verruconis gallopava]